MPLVGLVVALALLLSCTRGPSMDAQGGEAPIDETGASPSTPRSQIVPAPDAVALTDGEPGQWNLDDLQIASQHADELRRMLDDSLRDLPVGQIADELLRDHKRVQTLVEDVETHGPVPLTVANVGPVDVRANLLCVADFQQRACTGDGDVISVELPAWSASQAVLNIDHHESQFVFVLILIEDDRYAGVFSTSKTRLIHEPPGADPRATLPVVDMGDFEVGSVIPGCGVALFQDRSRLGQAPPESVSRNTDLAVVSEPCDDFEPVWSIALLIRDRTDLVTVDWAARPFTWERTLELPVPGRWIRDEETESLQFVQLIYEDGWWLAEHAAEVALG